MKKTLLLVLLSITVVSASQTGIEVFKQCGTCHGDKGQKHSLNVTNFIAGMDKEDVIEILHEYKDGKRNKYGLGTMMKGQAGKLNDEQMDAVATYISELQPIEDDRPKVKKENKTLDGAEIFKKCGVCHGSKANKRSLNVSKFIAGMNKDHIIETLHGYQAGKINQYGFGSMMKGQAKKLSEEQLEAVALYVQSLTHVQTKAEEEAEKEAKRITKEEVEYNTFLKEHFDKSTNPNETFEEAKRRWKEAKANKAKEEPESVKTEPKKAEEKKKPEEQIEAPKTELNLKKQQLNQRFKQTNQKKLKRKLKPFKQKKITILHGSQIYFKIITLIVKITSTSSKA